jgi:hypothetical protein
LVNVAIAATAERSARVVRILLRGQPVALYTLQTMGELLTPTYAAVFPYIPFTLLAHRFHVQRPRRVTYQREDGHMGWMDDPERLPPVTMLEHAASRGNLAPATLAMLSPHARGVAVLVLAGLVTEPVGRQMLLDLVA